MNIVFSTQRSDLQIITLDMLVNLVYYIRMKVINVFEAKTRLSQILDQVCQGQEIVIGKYGEPIAVLIPYRPKTKKRKLGGLKGKLRISDDFDAPLSAEFFINSDK